MTAQVDDKVLPSAPLAHLPNTSTPSQVIPPPGARSLTAKVAVITGGNSGIGSATVSSLLARGAKVASLDLSSPPEGSSSSNRIDIKCDVSSEDSVEAAVKEVVERFGQIDILINCAGVMDGFDQPSTTSTAMWNKVLSINLNGPFFTTRAVLPIMLKNNPQPAANAPPGFSARGEQLPSPAPSKGCIINICSVASIGGGSAGTAYTVSKHGLLGLTRSTAWMHRDDGIRCNAVLPGATATNIFANSKAPMNLEGYQKCQKYIDVAPSVVRTPDLVANAVVFLVESENVTGSEVKVDGGGLFVRSKELY